MNSLIIGSNGYIGRHLAKILHETGMQFSCCDIAEHSIDNYQNYQKIDIRQKKQIGQLNFDVDVVFIFSGLTGTTASLKNYAEFIDINEKGLLNILDCIKNQNLTPRIVYPSTRLVYKGDTLPLNENSELEAKTIYASNKINCENYLKLFSDYYNIPFTVFRICVPYGNLIDNAYSYGTIGFFISQALANKNITIYGSGSPKRTFTHIYDVVMQILESIKFESSKNEIFNIGGETVSLIDVANLIAAKFNSSIKMIPWPDFDLKIESGSTFFNSSKIENLTIYKYQYTIEKWLNQI